MQPYAALRGVAALLLIHYLYLGGENESVEETMQALGLTNRNYFYRARAELYRLGLLNRDGTIPGFSPKVVWHPVTASGVQMVSVFVEPEPEPEPEPAPPVSTSPISQAAEIDRMDASGDIRKPTSPAQARRKAQVAFLREQYERLFPGKFLSEPRAKELLALGDESAEIVLGVLEGIPSHIEYPYGYGKKVLEGEKRERPRDIVAPTVRTTSLEPEREPDYYLDKPTDRIAAKMAKLAALGKLHVEDDND